VRIAVVMSGGSGRRFWPVSRKARPKQLVPLVGGKCLLELTIERLLPVFAPDAIWIVTRAEQLEATRAAVARFGDLTLLVEPVGKNTAPCIAYAATVAQATLGDASLVVLPADHLIADEARFRDLVAGGLAFVEGRKSLLTLGITPDRPATGYGYIRRGKRAEDLGGSTFFKVTRFTEKPSLRAARRYLGSGAYLWNAGIFFFRASVMLEELARHLPQVAAEFKALGPHIGRSDEPERTAECYSRVESVSIDSGVLEKARRTWVLPADIGWDDLGSWTSFAKYMDKDAVGNSLRAQHVGVDSEGCVIYADGRFVATIGIKDLLVVATDDAILLVKREDAERVKELTDLMEEKGLDNLL
jgi:mannose-1-phosphate guanylyltransferase